VVALLTPQPQPLPQAEPQPEPQLQPKPKPKPKPKTPPPSQPQPQPQAGEWFRSGSEVTLIGGAAASVAFYTAKLVDFLVSKSGVPYH
jgi:hypothetical protein